MSGAKFQIVDRAGREVGGATTLAIARGMAGHMNAMPSDFRMPPYRVQELVTRQFWKDVPEPVDPRIEVVKRVLSEPGGYSAPYAERARRILAALDAMSEDER